MNKKMLFRCAIALLCAAGILIADEGMYPISEIGKLNLRSKGFQIDSKELYNPNGTSLVDAVVSLGGCTGSFVSSDGLIITNHHCVFGSVQAVSTVENNYTANGFLAVGREKEIPAKGLTVRIIQSYHDVSQEVLAGISDTTDPGERTKIIAKKIKEIVAAIEKKNPGSRAEIAEMFAGKTYVLFLYTFIKDARLVYIPPRSIGEFGGENDNWVWPRHTGDFSFIRAYVARDGSPADYSPENVPYHPKKYFHVQPDGVDENDFAFILGYPGRTFRHRTASYMAYEETVRMPYVADLYEWQIETMEKVSAADREVALKHTGRIKSLANTMKNYRGKIQGMHRLNLVASKEKEEQQLQAFIDEDPKLHTRYGTVLSDIKKVYDEMTVRAPYELLMDNLRIPLLLSYGYSVLDASRERQKNDLDRAATYMDRNFNQTKDGMIRGLKNFDAPTDKIYFKEMLLRASRLPADRRIAAVDEIIGKDVPEQAIGRFIENAYRVSNLTDEKILSGYFDLPPHDIEKIDDPIIRFARALYPAYQSLKEIRDRREGALSKLSALLVDVKQQYQKKEFIPDANSTLRLTFGRIRGYSPADAIYYSPITTLSGVMEKTRNREPYNTPVKVKELYGKRDFGRFQSKKLKDVPVAILYDMDTTGGNSGSPVLNAKGELVGINFDRAYEATINDYAWNENYSRSIAVDIRYVLWVTQKIGGADFLLKEMGIE